MSSPGQTFTIRAATREDMPAIVGIYNWAINQTFATIDSEPLSREEAAEWWNAHAGKTVTLVAADDDMIAGWARLLPWKLRGYEVVEDLVYVDPLYQGRGVGKQLLARLIEEARSTGCKTIVATWQLGVWVTISNRPLRRLSSVSLRSFMLGTTALKC